VAANAIANDRLAEAQKKRTFLIDQETMSIHKQNDASTYANSYTASHMGGTPTEQAMIGPLLQIEAEQKDVRRQRVETANGRPAG
jgi:hypothetical protein